MCPAQYGSAVIEARRVRIRPQRATAVSEFDPDYRDAGLGDRVPQPQEHRPGRREGYRRAAMDVQHARRRAGPIQSSAWVTG